ncbi:energy transducer TonB [Pontibacter sp. SGAir0037]|uniref:energy transducer TonB n=1 Tax=Pontibacter sp. SGAir0037 TaxID=2571030 RepID=UPI0010CD011A|nr:energy transducer TonB [Pontibacter sp. SGAir0037]QCR23023.1 hypothetical protein C1N53_12165 [Pontibacter sp. SGAir0037]
MRLSIILIVLNLLHLRLYAQEAKQKQLPCDTAVYQEALPVFPGGEQALFKFIEENMQYPAAALHDKVGGKVVVSYLIDTTGTVTDVRLVAGVREDLNQEAMRLVAALPAFTPATQQCKKVSVRYTLPMHFYPNNRWKRKYKKGKIASGEPL